MVVHTVMNWKQEQSKGVHFGRIFVTVWIPERYSGALKSNLSKSGKYLKSGIFEGSISNGRALAMAIALVPTIWKQAHSKFRHFCRDFKWFWQNGDHLSRFQMVGLPDFRFHSKSRPLQPTPLFDHSESRLVLISDPTALVSQLNEIKLFFSYR